MRIIIDCPWYIRTCGVPNASGGIDFEKFFFLKLFISVYLASVEFLLLCVSGWGEVFISEVW